MMALQAERNDGRLLKTVSKVVSVEEHVSGLLLRGRTGNEKPHRKSAGGIGRGVEGGVWTVGPLQASARIGKPDPVAVGGKEIRSVGAHTGIFNTDPKAVVRLSHSDPHRAPVLTWGNAVPQGVLDQRL